MAEAGCQPGSLYFHGEKTGMECLFNLAAACEVTVQD
jgi:hypothetical protein